MAMGQFCIEQLNAQTHTSTHARPNYSMVDVDGFPLLATHCVSALRADRNQNYWRFSSWQANTHAQITRSRFSASKNRHNIFQNVENRKHFRNQCLHIMVCESVYSFIFLLNFCCSYFVACELTLRSHFGNAT